MRNLALVARSYIMYSYVSMHDVSKCVQEELTSGILLGYRMMCKRFETKAQDSNKYPKANRWRNGPWRLLAIQLLTSWSLTYSLAQPDVCAHFAHEQNTMPALRMRNKLCSSRMEVWKRGNADGSKEAPMEVWKRRWKYGSADGSSRW